MVESCELLVDKWLEFLLERKEDRWSADPQTTINSKQLLVVLLLQWPSQKRG